MVTLQHVAEAGGACVSRGGEFPIPGPRTGQALPQTVDLTGKILATLWHLVPTMVVINYLVFPIHIPTKRERLLVVQASLVYFSQRLYARAIVVYTTGHLDVPFIVTYILPLPIIWPNPFQEV